MTLEEIHAKTNISLRTLRRLDKLGVLVVTEASDPLLDKIKIALKRRNRLSVLQILHLMKNAEILTQAETVRFEVNELIEALGDMADAAPWDTVASKIDLAAKSDVESVQRIAIYVRGVLDSLPAGCEVNHAYVGVRLLWNVPAGLRETLSGKLIMALWKVRQAAVLDGYFSTNEESQAIIYKNPKIVLDL